MEINELKAELEKSINRYIDIFSEKQEIDFDYWIGNHIGSVACFGDYFFDFNDIRLDLDTNQPKDSIFNWYNTVLDVKLNVNYNSWCMGYRPDLDKNYKRKEILKRIVNGDITPIEGDTELINLFGGSKNCEVLILSCANPNMWYNDKTGNKFKYNSRNETQYLIELYDEILPVNQYDAVIVERDYIPTIKNK